MKIGVFDSGIGGLSIALEIKKQLPTAELVYYADSAFSPYGDLSLSTLQRRCDYIVDHLINLGCHLIVVACNTATVNSINALRLKYSVPFVGVEPGVRPALLHTKNGRVSVLATSRTIESKHYQAVKQTHGNKMVHDVKCIGLADAIEHIAIPAQTDQSSSPTQRDETPFRINFDLSGLITSVIDHGSDVVVLACTHYNLIKQNIQQILDANVSHAMIIDTAEAVVKQVVRLANMQGKGSPIADVEGNVTFVTSGELAHFTFQIEHWWPYNSHVIVGDTCQPKVPQC